MPSEHLEYIDFCHRAIMDRSINSLIGVIEGIAIDGHVNATETEFLEFWVKRHREVRFRHPFNELMPALEHALRDGVINDEERQDLLWLCRRLTSTSFYERITADIQRLHAMLGAITADSVISVEELRGLQDWLDEHDHLRCTFPYEEINTAITQVLQDGHVTPDEHKFLFALFTAFLPELRNRKVTPIIGIDGTKLAALCATCPEITFEGSTFCVTGESKKLKRTEFHDIVRSRGGRHVESVSSKVDYLIVGADGNPCWSYACYGRKIEKAYDLRQNGSRILIVHENDFHDAIV